MSGLTIELSPEQISQMLADAMSVRDRGSFLSPKRSTVEDAFHEAVRSVVRQQVEQMLAADPSFQERIRALFADACERVFVANRDATVKHIADQIADGLSPSDRY